MDKKEKIDLDKELVARRIQDVLKDRGYKQVDLVEGIGLSQTLTSRYMTTGEKGRVPGAENLFRIASFLNVSSDYLIGLESDMVDILEEIKALSKTRSTKNMAKIEELTDRLLFYFSGSE